MHFLIRIRQSVYDPKFYFTLRFRPLRTAFSYFYTLLTGLSFLVALSALFILVPPLTSFIHRAPGYLNAFYPDGLTLTIKNGTISTSKLESYSFPLPNGLKESAVIPPDIDRLIAINTREDRPVEHFPEYRTLLLVGKDTLAYRDERGIQTIPASELPNTTISRQSLDHAVARLQSFLPFLAPAAVLAAFLASFILFNFTLLFLAAGAFVILIFTKIKHAPLTYRQSYAIALHGATLPLIMSVLLWCFTFILLPPIFFTLLFLVSIFFNMQYDIKKPA
ncbi:MAG: DUF1189 family protein, partial [Candidatus Sungbacteria bacterium]|nr:DUF1189 family protein [Candidatus Sungbacteria bacterium]